MARKRNDKPKSPPSESLGLNEFKQPAETTGLSLDQLSAAFAEMLSTGDTPYEEPAAAAEEPADILDGDSAHGADEPSESSDTCEISPRSILEAMLFVGSPANEPLSGQHVASLMRGVRPAEIDQLVRELNDRYAADGCPYEIVSEGPGYRMALRSEYFRVRDRFYGKVRQARLSQAAIEVLSLVAYHEPLTADDVNRLRGTPSGAILSQLVRRQLLKLDRSDPEFRRGRYFTTPRFLRLFGLESLDELPRSDDAVLPSPAAL